MATFKNAFKKIALRQLKALLPLLALALPSLSLAAPAPFWSFWCGVQDSEIKIQFNLPTGPSAENEGATLYLSLPGETSPRSTQIPFPQVVFGHAANGLPYIQDLNAHLGRAGDIHIQAGEIQSDLSMVTTSAVMTSNLMELNFPDGVTLEYCTTLEVVYRPAPIVSGGN